MSNVDRIVEAYDKTIADLKQQILFFINRVAVLEETIRRMKDPARTDK